MFYRKSYLKKYLKNVKKDCSNTEIPEDILNLYEEYRDQIRDIYTDVTHWHGTGRYHYKTKGCSKYDLGISNEEVEDVLQNIITNEQIVKYFDPWMEQDGTHKESVSTSRWKAYSRIYAEMNCTEETRPLFTYGDRKKVMRFFLTYTLLNIPLIFYPLVFYRGRYNKDINRKGAIWVSTTNNSLKSKGDAYKDVYYMCGEAYSNIMDNYGILFGIKGESLRDTDVYPMIRIFENRFDHNISLDLITHLEVPLSKFEETKNIVKKYNIDIPVLPLEACELYYSTLPTEEFFNMRGAQIRTKLKDFWEYFIVKKYRV